MFSTAAQAAQYDTRPMPRRAAANRRDTVAAQRVPVQELTGTLEIEVESARYARATDGWLFINGELQARLPIRKEFLLVPGEYELRVVLAGDWPLGNLYFRTLTRQIRIERGKRTTIIRTEGLFGDFEEDRSREVVSSRNFGVVDLSGNWRNNVAAFRSLRDRGWQSFVDSPGWKAIASAAERLRTFPPTRPRAWVDLPKDLGGARELDADQLRALRHYFLAIYDFENGAWTDTIGADSLSPGEKVHAIAEASALIELIRARREWLGKVMEEMITMLERAPKTD
jgi:hypothetical protein